MITAIPLDSRKRRESVLLPYGGKETSLVYAPAPETGWLVLNIDKVQCVSIVDIPEGSEIRVTWLDDQVRTYYSVDNSDTVRSRLIANATSGQPSE